MRDGSETKANIERCALELFVKKGVQATTIKDISQKANVAEGTLYRHHESKYALADYLFLHAYYRITEELNSRAMQPGSLKDKLRALVEYYCEEFDHDSLMLNYLLINQHAQVEKINAHPHNVNKILVSLFSEAYTRGELKISDPYLCSSVFMGIMIQSGIDRIYGRIQKKMSDDAEFLYQAAIKALDLDTVLPNLSKSTHE